MANETHRQYDAIPYWKEIAEVIADYNGEKYPTQADRGGNDIFDVAEACSCIAHDWGEYNLQSYLEHKLNFHGRPNLTTDTLEELGALIYNRLNDIYGVEVYKEKWAEMKKEGAEETKGAPVPPPVAAPGIPAPIERRSAPRASRVARGRPKAGALVQKRGRPSRSVSKSRHGLKAHGG